MKMGMMESPEITPDLFNLPVYRVTKTMEERVGDHIHVLHGYVSFGQTVWTHMEIWDATDLVQTAGRCTELSMRPKIQRGPGGH